MAHQLFIIYCLDKLKYIYFTFYDCKITIHTLTQYIRGARYFEILEENWGIGQKQLSNVFKMHNDLQVFFLDLSAQNFFIEFLDELCKKIAIVKALSLS